MRSATGGPSDPPDSDRAVAMAAGVLELCWQPAHGYCAPNLQVYPWQWLWDSCFHSVIWATLGDERADIELRSLFAYQTESGLLPHMGYQKDPAASEALWGTNGRSTITQPPMFGHAIRELAAAGFSIPETLIDSSARAFRFLADKRRGPHGLIGIVHPWESGADNSPRWDPWQEGPFDRDRWMHRKLDMVATLEMDNTGSAIDNPQFNVFPSSFNALAAFNAAELAAVTGDPFLAGLAEELREGIDQLWNAEHSTWVDVDRDGAATSHAETIDALLPLLVTSDEAKFDLAAAKITDTNFFGAKYGPTAVAQSEPTFDPTGYWRGASWPHLSYLIWLALARRGRTDAEKQVMESLLASSVASSMSEYVQPFTGGGLGAQPQGWAGLAVVPLSSLARRESDPAGTSGAARAARTW